MDHELTGKDEAGDAAPFLSESELVDSLSGKSVYDKAGAIEAGVIRLRAWLCRKSSVCK